MSAFHRAPAVIAVLEVAGHIEVDSRAMNCAAIGQLLERFLLHPDAIRHGQELGNIVVVDDQHVSRPGYCAAI